MKKKKKMEGKNFKYLIPGIIAVILLSAIFLSNKFITKQNLESIYNIEEAGLNFDNIQIGDTVNYEVNGYSDWQVIGKDEYAGTIDVVSKTNTEYLTLESNNQKEYYENIFQDTANKYTNDHVINARMVNQNDLDYFSYDNDFWLNNINDVNIMTSQGTWQYDQGNIKNYNTYMIPYIEIELDDDSNYNVGDIIDYSNNGVDRWVVVNKVKWRPGLGLIPEIPIELVVESSYDNIGVWKKIDSFQQNGVIARGDYFSNNGFNIDNLSSYISSFLNQQTERIIFLGSSCLLNNSYTNNNTIIYNGCGKSYYYENGEFTILKYGDLIYTDTVITHEIGFRPVITLKIDRFEEEVINENAKKEISNNLKVGDNIKYEAKGYKNWKVLSIDNGLDTVDIISGGIVKNLTLSGKEDWNNYEDLIQGEVDKYKNGNQAKKATTVTSKELKILKQIDSNPLPRYWILSKNTFISRTFTFNNNDINLVYYHIGAATNYENNNSDETIFRNIAIYADFKGNQEAIEYYNKSGYYTDDINTLSYTAGLRPVITLKLDDVEKLPDKEAKKIEESTEKQEKIYIKEQETKNKDYKKPSGIDDTTSSIGDNNYNKPNSSNNNEIVYKEKPFYKYGFFTLLVICIMETIYIFVSKKHEKKHRTKNARKF